MRKFTHTIKSLPTIRAQIEPLEHRVLLSADLTGGFAGNVPRTLPVVAGTTQLTVRLKNTTTTRTNQTVHVQLFVAPSPVAGPMGILIASRQQSIRIEPRGSAILGFKAVSPTTLASGNYFLLAELNGALLTSTPVHVDAPFSDLAINFGGLPSRPIEIDGPSAGTQSARVNILNTGNIPAHGSVDVNLYLSADNSLDAADPLLITAATIPITLKPGARRSIPLQVAVPPGTLIGGYFLFARVNPVAAINDANPANNLFVSTTRVAVINRLPRPTHFTKNVNVYVSGYGSTEDLGYNPASVDGYADGSADAGSGDTTIDNSGTGDNSDSSNGWNNSSPISNTSSGSPDLGSSNTGNSNTGSTDPGPTSQPTTAPTESAPTSTTTDNWDASTVTSSGGDF